MPRKIKVSAVERLVDGYLSRFLHTSNTRRERQTIEYAIKLIRTTLVDPCCPGNAEEIVFGRIRSQFIINLQSALSGIDIRKWRESLLRARAALERVLGIPCCTETVEFRFFDEDLDFSGSTARISVKDGTDVVFRTLPLIEGNAERMVQTAEIKSGLYTYCIEFGDVDEVTDPTDLTSNVGAVVSESGPRVPSVCTGGTIALASTYDLTLQP